MTEAARRLLPTVEMRLRQVPGDAGVWAHWVTLSSVAGSRNLPTWASQVALKAGDAERARAWAGLKVDK